MSNEAERLQQENNDLLRQLLRGGGNNPGGGPPGTGSPPKNTFRWLETDLFANLKVTVKEFDRALDQSNTSLHTFSKYNYAVAGLTTAIGTLVTKTGTAGTVLSKSLNLLGTVVTEVSQLIFKQTDELLQASDQFAKIGAAGSLTTKDIMKMGEQVGLTTKDLGILTNATGKIGTGLIGLGANATDGIKAFAGMAEVGKDVRQEFQRMGVTQTELMDQQAKYVEIQVLSGKSMLNQTMGAEKLKKSSLEYSENLLRLSALTGKSADVLQEEQKQQAMELEEMIASRQENDKIAELRASGNKAEADSLQKEQDSRKAFVKDIEAKYGKAAGVALGKVARTGSYDQTTAGFANLGIDAGKLQSDLKNGVDGTKIANEMGEQLKSGMQSLLKNLGQGAQFNAQELFTSMGFTDFKELLGKVGTRIGINDQAQSDAAKKVFDDNKEGIGLAAKDFAQEARNYVKETENSLNLTKQGFIALANVFVQGPALVEKNLKDAEDKLLKFVTNLAPDSVIKAATAPSHYVPNANKAEAAVAGSAAAAAGAVGGALAGSVPVVGTAFKIIKKVGKTATWAAIIDMIGGDQIADWLKGDTKVEDIKKLPTTIATQTPIAVNAVKEELSPGPKQFENIKQGLQGIEKGWENTKNKFIKELTNLLGGLSEISSAPAAPVATPAATTGSPDTRSHGTTGETGKEVEPKDVVAQLHAGEKVLPKEEAKIYISAEKQGAVPVAAAPAAAKPVAAPAVVTTAVAPVAAAPAVVTTAVAPVAAAPAVATTVAAAPAGPLRGKSGDADQDTGPAVEAKSSTNKTNVGNFSIEDYIPNDRKMNDAETTYIQASLPTGTIDPNAGELGNQGPDYRMPLAPAEVATARPAISAAETLSKVTLEAVNPVVVDALKKITPSSAPEAAATAFNNSAEMMNKVLFSFNNKCDEMIKKLEEANDIATKILHHSY